MDLPCRFYQASSSEMFGATTAAPARGHRLPPPLALRGWPRFYALLGYPELPGGHMASMPSMASLFNHESTAQRTDIRHPEGGHGCRPDQSRSAGRTVPGQPRRPPRLGYAPEYVEAMWRMLQQDEPGRLSSSPPAPATACATSSSMCFRPRGPRLARPRSRFDDRYLRPTEVDDLVGRRIQSREDPRM